MNLPHNRMRQESHTTLMQRVATMDAPKLTGKALASSVRSASNTLAKASALLAASKASTPAAQVQVDAPIELSEVAVC